MDKPQSFPTPPPTTRVRSSWACAWWTSGFWPKQAHPPDARPTSPIREEDQGRQTDQRDAITENPSCGRHCHLRLRASAVLPHLRPSLPPHVRAALLRVVRLLPCVTRQRHPSGTGGLRLRGGAGCTRPAARARVLRARSCKRRRRRSGAYEKTKKKKKLQIHGTVFFSRRISSHQVRHVHIFVRVAPSEIFNFTGVWLVISSIAWGYSLYIVDCSV